MSQNLRVSCFFLLWKYLLDHSLSNCALQTTWACINKYWNYKIIGNWKGFWQYDRKWTMNSSYFRQPIPILCHIISLQPGSDIHQHFVTQNAMPTNTAWHTVLVTFLLLWSNTITKATYKRKSLIDLQFQRVRVHDGLVKKQQRSHILIYSHEAEIKKEQESSKTSKLANP